MKSTPAPSSTSVPVAGFRSGNLAAGDYIDLRSNGPISILNAVSGETISFETEGSLTALDLTAGDSVLGQAMGAIDVGTVSAGMVNPSSAGDAEYRVRFASDANIETGAVTAAGDIGFSTPGNLVTGNLNAGGGIMALVGGDISLPTVSASDYVFLADNSMAALGGDFETFDRSAVLAAEPVLTGGAIAISGPLTAGSFVTAAAGTNLNFTTIGAGSYVDLQAGNNITGSDITAGGNISLHAIGDISLGSATSSFASIMMDAGDDIALTGDLLADGDILLTAGGDIAMKNAMSGESTEIDVAGNLVALNLTAGDSIEVFADGSVNVGNLSSGLVNPSTSEGAEHSTLILAGANIVAGNIASAQDITLATPGMITALDIEAGGIFMALAHGDMSFGDADAGEVFLADYAMLLLGGENAATCVGACGTLGANGVVIAPPSGGTYTYVTTEGGVSGAGQLPGEGGTNGSLYTTSAFGAAAGDDLEFWFNYVTSDGSGYADYAWAAL